MTDFDFAAEFVAETGADFSDYAKAGNTGGFVD